MTSKVMEAMENKAMKTLQGWQADIMEGIYCACHEANVALQSVDDLRSALKDGYYALALEHANQVDRDLIGVNMASGSAEAMIQELKAMVARLHEIWDLCDDRNACAYPVTERVLSQAIQERRAILAKMASGEVLPSDHVEP